MFLRLTDLNGNLVLVPVQKVRYFGVRRFMKKWFTYVCLDDYSWLGGTHDICVKETIEEISLQVCHLETKSLRVRLNND